MVTIDYEHNAMSNPRSPFEFVRCVSGGTVVSIAEVGAAGSVGHPSDRGESGTRQPIALELCRVAVLARRCQLDLALPLDLPVALLLPGVVDMVRDHDASRAPIPEQSDAALQVWTLAHIGRPPLELSATLTENGVRDGDILILGSLDKPAPEPLFDDVMQSVATDDAEHQPLWTQRSAQTVALWCATGLTVTGCVRLIRTTLNLATRNDAIVAASVALGTSILMLLVAGIVSRLYFDKITASVLAACSLPLAFSAGIIFIPGAVEAPHLVLAAGLTGAVSIGAFRVTGVGLALFTGVSVVMISTLAAGIVSMLTDVPTHVIGAAAAAIALLGLAIAPRAAMLQARLPLPAVPVAGADRDGFAGDPETEDYTFEALAHSAARARGYLTGSTSAMAIVAAGGGLVAAFGGVTDEIYWPGTALALAVGAVVVLRGRTYAMIAHATPLIAGGTALLLTVLIGSAVKAQLNPIVEFGIVLALLAASLMFGVIIPQRTFSPVLRRLAELAEYAAIISIIPLVCWTAGLYTAIRGL